MGTRAVSSPAGPYPDGSRECVFGATARRAARGGDLGDGKLLPTFMAERPALLRYLRKCGGEDEAEDLMQDLWLKLKGGGEAEPRDALGYLLRMASNLLKDRRRAAARRRVREGSFVRDVIEPHLVPTTERALIARQDLHSIERSLARLGERTSHVFRRHRIGEMSQPAIAAELGISLSAVEKHLQKAYRCVWDAARSAESL